MDSQRSNPEGIRGNRRVLTRLIARTNRVLPFLVGKGLEEALKEQKRLKEKLKCE